MNKILQQPVNSEYVDTYGVDFNAAGKFLSELNLLRAIHNPETSSIIHRGASLELENPKYHNEPTHLHVRYVGSIMSTIIGFRPHFLDEYGTEYTDNFFGYDQNYISHLEGAIELQDLTREHKAEMAMKRELLVAAQKLQAHLDLGSNEQFILFLWSYLHDSGKIIRPEIKHLEHTNSGIAIMKDAEGETIKSDNKLFYLLGLQEGNFNKYEILDRLNIYIFRTLERLGAISRDFADRLDTLQSSYEVITASLKGYGDDRCVDDSRDYKLALIAVIADELGKGNYYYFRDESGHAVRMNKYNLLLSIVESI